ncbi:hypothetical protein GCM10010358_00340 [Streptomyces minutiscleroticus]|uniref:Uncharacterized protein n=1 Tax=Streptomyces minutiscleroticus TaxID=68238 RepID=A0A918N8E6_9ACTN|nr:hypothetical protein GCM10010358_00340 [Streptomyces minutiscleroticus]
MQQDDARQDLLPGAAGPAPLGGLGGGDAAPAELGGGQHPLPYVGQPAKGVGGERGVVVHAPQFPVPDRSRNSCYTFVDKAGRARPKVQAFESRKPLVRTEVTGPITCIP